MSVAIAALPTVCGSVWQWQLHPGYEIGIQAQFRFRWGFRKFSVPISYRGFPRQTTCHMRRTRGRPGPHYPTRVSIGQYPAWASVSTFVLEFSFLSEFLVFLSFRKHLNNLPRPFWHLRSLLSVRDIWKSTRFAILRCEIGFRNFRFFFNFTGLDIFGFFEFSGLEIIFFFLFYFSGSKISLKINVQ